MAFGTNETVSGYWQPDNEACVCLLCGQRFQLFTFRRHHCRHCGRVVCASCSKQRIWLKESLQRICDDCCLKFYSKKQAKTFEIRDRQAVEAAEGGNEIQNATSMHENIMYKTRSVCARCCFGDSKGAELVEAMVVEKAGAVHMKINCTTHGHSYVQICSNVDFFNRINAFKRTSKKLVDLEDMESYTQKPSQAELPLSFEIAIFCDHFSSNDELEVIVKRFEQLYADCKHSNAVVKVSTGLPEPHQIKELNRVIQNLFDRVVSGQLHDAVMVVELEYQRLIDVAALADSVLLNRRIWPALRYSLSAGYEQQCVEELRTTLNVLSQYENIELVFMLTVDRPLPDLSQVLHISQQHPSLLRYFIISCEPLPNDYFSSIFTLSDDSVEKVTTDPYEIVSLLHEASNGALSSSDFVPVNLLHDISPLLKHFGYGNFALNPSPMCAFGSIMMNTYQHRFMSLARLVDITKLHDLLSNISSRLNREAYGAWCTKQLNKAIKDSAKSALIIEMFSYLLNSDSEKQQQLEDILLSMQYIIVHNKMSLVSFDATRRCGCAAVTLQNDTIVAQCTGCL